MLLLAWAGHKIVCAHTLCDPWGTEEKRGGAAAQPAGLLRKSSFGETVNVASTMHFLKVETACDWLLENVEKIWKRIKRIQT